jgi:hypothetical protein
VWPPGKYGDTGIVVDGELKMAVKGEARLPPKWRRMLEQAERYPDDDDGSGVVE